jgi:predicted small secreted protein
MFARLTILAILLVLSVVMTACESSSGDGQDAENGPPASLDDFVDGSWQLRVDRAWNGIDGNITFPSDQFSEADYQPVSTGPTYPIVVSDQTTRLSIGSPPLTGSRWTPPGDTIVYDLTEGTFAGGRFIVWAGAQGLQAELTIYGSGRPIVKSERGSLAPSS